MFMRKVSLFPFLASNKNERRLARKRERDRKWNKWKIPLALNLLSYLAPRSLWLLYGADSLRALNTFFDQLTNLQERTFSRLSQ